MRAGEQTLPRPGQRALQRHICEGGVRWHPGGWRQSRLCHRHHPARRAPVMEVGRYWHAIRQTLYVIQIRSFSEACFATSDRLNRNRARNNVQSRSSSVADAEAARTAVPLLTPRSNGPSGNWVSAGFACSASALFCISHNAPPAPPTAMAEKSIDRHVVVEFSWVGPANDWLAEIPRQLLRRSCDARTVSIFLRGRSRNDRDPLPPRCRPHCRPHRNFAAD